MENKPQPSPYFSGDTELELMKEIDTLMSKHGYKQFGWFGSKTPYSEESDSYWTGGSNVISEGMVAYMENTVEYMKDTLEASEE